MMAAALYACVAYAWDRASLVHKPIEERAAVLEGDDFKQPENVLKQ